MYLPLCVKTDHSLLKSMVKIDDLINFCLNNNITSCGICDNNMFGVIEFYHKCHKNNLKPILGLNIAINNQDIYLYAKNYSGYQNLLKINTIMQERDLSIKDLEKYSLNVICVVPYQSNELFESLKKLYENIFISYSSSYEKNNSLIITKNIVFMPQIKALKLEDTKYLNYLNMINEGTNIHNHKMINFDKNYYLEEYDNEDQNTTIDFANLIDVNIPTNKIYIPKYKEEQDSYLYLLALTKKGLVKRLNNKENKIYQERLEYELSVIKEMGFVDYFLIVYDYILFAKKHDILVGPGRGSAAGSLVAYSLGITDIDPIKYDLLFERFLNKERITMPDIDIDFEDTKRNDVVEYLKEKYGYDKVANIMTYSTLSAKQALRDVARILNIDEIKVSKLLSYINAKETLKQNYQNKDDLKKIILTDSSLKQLFQISLKLEKLKRQISTHAAGVIISSEKLDNLIPMVKTGENILTGCTMEYLEELGLIKMDLLAIKNLRTIKDVLELIKQNNNIDIKLNNIPLNDKKTLEMFHKGNTVGIFQFESEGMKSFLQKLKPSNFEELIAAIALFRPGPMDNIPEYIRRKEGKAKIEYLHPSLESILKETYGIIVYQEQIMQILVMMANYSYSEADNIRRAMSKKKKEIIDKERNIFIKRSIKNNYSQEIAEKVYTLIEKFANYGFNKSHSVAYALIGYQMAYLKAHYQTIFYANLLNMSISSEVKTNEYLNVIKAENIKIYHPLINASLDKYLIKDNNLLLPLGTVKNVGTQAVAEIINERQKGKYIDFYDFIKRVYGKSVTRKVIESLIYAGAFQEFKHNKNTLLQNLDSAIDYAELTKDIDSPLILKPQMEIFEEFNDKELITQEKEVLGFYVTNHPASKYKENVTKIQEVPKFFDKYVKCVVLATRINNIQTKKGETMSFITAEDETGTLDFIVFPNKNSLMTKFKKDNLILISGRVEKRIDKYQIVVSNIEKIK